MQIKTQQM